MELFKKGIRNEKVLNAINIIPRHLFLHKDFENFAYIDKPFPIGEDQTISQPYTVAFQTEKLEIIETSSQTYLRTHESNT